MQKGRSCASKHVNYITNISQKAKKRRLEYGGLRAASKSLQRCSNLDHEVDANDHDLRNLCRLPPSEILSRNRRHPVS